MNTGMIVNIMFSFALCIICYLIGNHVGENAGFFKAMGSMKISFEKLAEGLDEAGMEIIKKEEESDD